MLHVWVALVEDAPMRPYSQDLREKIIRALEAVETQEEVADRFSVSLSLVEKLWRRWRRRC
jgi:transposase